MLFTQNIDRNLILIECKISVHLIVFSFFWCTWFLRIAMYSVHFRSNGIPAAAARWLGCYRQHHFHTDFVYCVNGKSVSVNCFCFEVLLIHSKFLKFITSPRITVVCLFATKTREYFRLRRCDCAISLECNTVVFVYFKYKWTISNYRLWLNHNHSNRIKCILEGHYRQYLSNYLYLILWPSPFLSVCVLCRHFAVSS